MNDDKDEGEKVEEETNKFSIFYFWPVKSDAFCIWQTLQLTEPYHKSQNNKSLISP